MNTNFGYFTLSCINETVGSGKKVSLNPTDKLTAHTIVLVVSNVQS